MDWSPPGCGRLNNPTNHHPPFQRKTQIHSFTPVQPSFSSTSTTLYPHQKPPKITPKLPPIRPTTLDIDSRSRFGLAERCMYAYEKLWFPPFPIFLLFVRSSWASLAWLLAWLFSFMHGWLLVLSLRTSLRTSEGLVLNVFYVMNVFVFVLNEWESERWNGRALVVEYLGRKVHCVAGSWVAFWERCVVESVVVERCAVYTLVWEISPLESVMDSE